LANFALNEIVYNCKLWSKNFLNNYFFLIQTLIENPVKSVLPAKADEETFEGVLVKSSKEFLIKAAGIIISRPFYVIAVRQIATIAQGTNDTGIIAPLKVR